MNIRSFLIIVSLFWLVYLVPIMIGQTFGDAPYKFTFAPTVAYLAASVLVAAILSGKDDE